MSTALLRLPAAAAGARQWLGVSCGPFDGRASERDRWVRGDLEAGAEGRRGEPGCAEHVYRTVCPLHPGHRSVTRPPLFATPLIGRDPELDGLRGAIEKSPGLWTIVGPGGVGKTRLAAGVAASWTGTQHWVDLQAARNEAALLRSLSHAMGLGAEAEPGAILARGGRTLLVLDNFEQLVEPCAERVEEWVRQAGVVRVLVTSRQPLAVRCERLVELFPLAAESAGAVFWGIASAFDRSSVDPVLFAEVLDALQGLPLALELAAARLDVLTMAELRDRLSDPLALLNTPLPARARSMEAAVTRSWDLLTDVERAALGQCAVFHGGWTLEAAEAVIDIEESVVDVLHHLRHRHLITHDRGRFGMLEVIRQYSAKKALDSGAGRRHGAFYGALAAERVERGAWGTRDALDVLAAEFDNLRAVVDAAPQVASIEDGMRAGEALGVVLQSRGPPQAQIPVIEEVLALCADHPRYRGRCLRQRAVFLRRAGRHREALADLREAKGLAEGSLRAAIRADLADLLSDMGEPEAGASELEVALLEAGDDPEVEAHVCSCLAFGEHDRQRHQAAQIWWERALAAAKRSGSAFRQAKVLGMISTICIETRRWAEARTHAARAMVLFEALGIPRSIAHTSGQLAQLAQLDGDTDEAEALYRRAVAGAREARDDRLTGSWLGTLGSMLVINGRGPEGRHQLLESIRLLGDGTSQRLALNFRSMLAFEAALRGDVETTRAHAEAVCEMDRVSASWGRSLLALEVALCLRTVATGDDAAARVHFAQTQELFAQFDDGPRKLELGILVDLAGVSAHGWAIAADGAWFRAPGGARVRPSGTHVAVLARLAAGRGGAPVQVADLLDAGWLGERITEKAAVNRVNVALAGLRKLGLGPILKSVRPGWQLDPDVAVAIVSAI